MTPIAPYFKIAPHASPSAEAVVLAGGQAGTPAARFTVLTSRLIRMEYHPDGIFEDRPSQIFWHRCQPVPPFQTAPVAAGKGEAETGNGVEIITAQLHLRYLGGAFSRETLSVEVKPGAESDPSVEWRFGDVDSGNLLGTARTLDGIHGQTQLEPGLMSRAGWTVVDDSKGLVFNAEGWLEPRPNSHPAGCDLYFFGYGQDYQACLADYCRLSGQTPVIPRWVLGNWWSRYWAYSQQELSELMLDFKAHEVPLAVCIVDMDWHLEGWTGYTWNRNLFPDPPGFVRFLHSLGLKTALNLHPADGIGPHEAAYPQMAAAMGIDPDSKQKVKFDIENPDFSMPYFDILHHPQEVEGIDFWWMDWQQGNPSRLPGLNLLWWINHLHFTDLGRREAGKTEAKRAFVFSRWGGLGNHRYPIGFSGDTVVSWESLAFQPYFTATAANVGYGWWSHDIGGHMGGTEDAELYTRWVQFGVFSPIMRLHSTKNMFHERRPWGYDGETLRITRSAMQLRHALIPYLYSMAWRNHQEGIPLIRPMYHVYPQHEEAYACPNQYLFGSELIAAPFITPRHPDTRLSRQVVWLPEGNWVGLFDGKHYSGGWHAIYGGLDDIPVFARAGAIVPLADLPAWGGLENPPALTLHAFPDAFPGAAKSDARRSRFELYEDDGVSGDYLDGAYALSSYELDQNENRFCLRIEPVKGQRRVIPAERDYTVVLHIPTAPESVELVKNGARLSPSFIYDAPKRTLTLSNFSLLPSDAVEIQVQLTPKLSSDRPDTTLVEGLLRSFRAPSSVKQALFRRLPELATDPAVVLAGFMHALTSAQMQALIETAAGCGVEQITQAGEAQIVLWNNRGDPQAGYTLSVEQLDVSDAGRFKAETGIVPAFKVIRPARDYRTRRWARFYPGLLRVNYGDLFHLEIPINRPGPAA